MLRAAADEVGLPVLGALPRRGELAVPSRHLGLVTAAEHGAAATAAVDAMAELVGAHVDLDAVARLAAPLPPGPVWDAAAECPPGLAPGSAPSPRSSGGRRSPSATPSTSSCCAAAGAEVAVVDPLHDEALPPGTAALVLPGGFPEEHVAELSANAPLRAAVAALAGSGAPVHAECGGLLYLCEELDGAPMCGVLPARRRHDRPAHPGLPRRRGADRLGAVRGGSTG